MKFSVVKHGTNEVRDTMINELIRYFQYHGMCETTDTNGVQFVLNLTDIGQTQFFRRKHQQVFVISVVDGSSIRENLRATCYTTLIKSLSNLLICIIQRPNMPAEVYFTTPEAGFYHVPYQVESVYKHILPIAGSHFSTYNQLKPNLPERLYTGSHIVQSISHYGKIIDALGVLPTPFPLQDVLTDEQLNHIYKIFGITGASYGNLSAREYIPEFAKSCFWMTGRGVNKAALNKVGKDILLVTGFDEQEETAYLSMPKEFNPKVRVSVDAIEHYMIYKSYPNVGAIVHLHAWMENIVCTKQNYPCGTKELAYEVVNLLRTTPDPSHAVVGLINHGLTITGESLEEIFKRISGKLQTTVPMIL